MPTLNAEETLAELVRNTLTEKEKKPYILATIEPNHTDIVQEAPVHHESPNSCLVTIHPAHTKSITYLLVSACPKLCVHRIHVSTAYSRKSIKTLKRLRYNNNQMIRSAAELEISLRHGDKQ